MTGHLGALAPGNVPGVAPNSEARIRADGQRRTTNVRGSSPRNRAHLGSATFPNGRAAAHPVALDHGCRSRASQGSPASVPAASGWDQHDRQRSQPGGRPPLAQRAESPRDVRGLLATLTFGIQGTATRMHIGSVAVAQLDATARY